MDFWMPTACSRRHSMSEWRNLPATVASVHLWQGLSVTKEAWKDNRFLTLPHGFFTSESKHARPVDKRFHCATL
jgi:hypothetical protein